MMYGALRNQLEPLVRKGWSNAALIAAFPQMKPNSVRVTAHKLRAELGVPHCNAGTKPIYLTLDLLGALKAEAEARDGYGTGTAQDLALRLLAIIVRDDLFNAILDDGR